MQHLVFESVESLDQRQFAEFVGRRVQAGDAGQCELLNGRVVMNPPAGYPHGEIGSLIQVLLGSFVAQHRSGKVFDSSQGFELPSGDTVEPDHSFVSKERWRAAPPPEQGQFLRVVPDLIVEVLSVRTASRDRGEKKAIYERNGVLEYWLVDPLTRSLTVFLLEGDRFDAGHVYSDGTRYASRVMSALELGVSQILP